MSRPGPMLNIHFIHLLCLQQALLLSFVLYTPIAHLNFSCVKNSLENYHTLNLKSDVISPLVESVKGGFGK